MTTTNASIDAPMVVLLAGLTESLLRELGEGRVLSLGGDKNNTIGDIVTIVGTTRGGSPPDAAYTHYSMQASSV